MKIILTKQKWNDNFYLLDELMGKVHKIDSWATYYRYKAQIDSYEKNIKMKFITKKEAELYGKDEGDLY